MSSGAPAGTDGEGAAYRGWAWPLVALHRRLLPPRKDIGWTPYLWLFYLSWPITRWVVHPPGPKMLVLGCLTLVVFLALYFHGFWRSGLRLLWNMAAIAALGVLWLRFDGSLMIFFVYAAGFTGAVGVPKVGRRVLLAIVAVVGLSAWWVQLPWLLTLLCVCLCGIIGATNIYYSEIARRGEDLRRSQEEVERLATMAERERISRDLHDLLGHTLSLITVKAELARKLSERDDPRAATEIADVERISRQALRQVREAVEGFRQAGLVGELSRAQIACDARNIILERQVAPVSLQTRQEAALAMVLREAMTNVMRHSQASRCEITLGIEDASVILTVKDDGLGDRTSKGLVSEADTGHGLIGMEERLAALGGTLHCDGSEGWRLEARMPSTDASPLVERSSGTDLSQAGLAHEEI